MQLHSAWHVGTAPLGLAGRTSEGPPVEVCGFESEPEGARLLVERLVDAVQTGNVEGF